ncbi:MAG: hypothetical protein KDC57_19000, partial [Saprospiraceae bacterium]|nr:hypothetical protein [Saprospiraceae bacterium]
SCLNAETAAANVKEADNCNAYGDPKVEILQTKWESFDCNADSPLSGYVARVIRATDVWGNFVECHDTIFIIREFIDALACPDDVEVECTTTVIRDNKEVELLWNAGKDGDTYLDDQGYAHPWPTDASGYFPAPHLVSVVTGQPDAYFLPGRSDSGPVFDKQGKCQILFDYEDHVLPTCGKSYKIRRTWHIYDWCRGTEATCTQWLKIKDTESPVIDLKYLGSSNRYELLSNDEIIASEKSIGINLLGPVGLYSIGNGHFLVTDLNDDAVYEIDQAGNILRLLFTVPSELNTVGITSDGNMLIYLGNSQSGPTSSVVVYDMNGNLQYSFNVSDRTVFPEGIAYNSKDHLLYLVDGTGVNRVLVYTMQGNFVTEYPIEGFSPDGMVYDNAFNGFWIYDSGTQGLRLYSSDFSQILSSTTVTFGGEGLALYGERVYLVQSSTRSLFSYQVRSEINKLAEPLKATVGPHDCKAGIEVPDPRAYISKDCDTEFRVYYEVAYSDPSHPGKEMLETSEIAAGASGHLYLPKGKYTLIYHIADQCWNERIILKDIIVYDDTPPVPVCDEITQVSLDPKECWARVYAKDLDDGSHDNCCQQLHFAVANMDSVTYWRNYWHDYFIGCIGENKYYSGKDGYETFIEEWINTFVFDDYIDVTECGSEQLVLRVYEACDLPVYDPHAFFGGEHKWYWYNHSRVFQTFYLWKLDEFIHYGDPRYQIICDGDFLRYDFPVIGMPIVYDHADNNPSLTESGYSGCGVAGLPNGSIWEFELPELRNVHAPVPWGLCSWQIYTEEGVEDWKSRVFEPYRTEAEITKRLNLTTPYYTPVRYSDCMIEVLKDDKIPPVVIAPEDITVYCDGVPYWWELTKPYAGGTKTATVKGHGASFTHDVCEGEDALATYCADPYIYPTGWNTSGAPVEATTVCCVEIPWDGGDYGYYGGSVCGESTYAGGVNCDEYSYWYKDHNWQPIYCRLWLMLDKYDNPDGG